MGTIAEKRSRGTYAAEHVMNPSTRQDSQALTEHFARFLRSRGLRLTRERRDILEHIFAAHTHFEAEDLQMRLREAGHRVSKATIYRTLKLLLESGVLRTTMTPPDAISAQYELAHGPERHHDHIYCENCGKMVELSDPGIRRQLREQAEALGFEVTDVSVHLTGLCGDCREGDPGPGD